MSEEIIDLPDVLERVQDDKELLLELFDIFEGEFGKKRQALGAAVAAKDIQKIKEISHSLKGASGNISIKPMHALCVQMEQLAKANTTEGMDALLTRLDEQHTAFLAHAAKLKKEWGG